MPTSATWIGSCTEAVDCLKSNFFKTELELGHCLRLPQEGPCGCDLYLACPRRRALYIYTQLVYSARASDVRLVTVRERIVVETVA